MKQFIQTNSLSEMLNSFQQDSQPTLVKLNTRKGADYLMDIMIDRVMKDAKNEIRSVALDQTSSIRINQELHLQSNPSLLLIYNGEIRSILSGITSRHQIEEVLAQLQGTETKRQSI